MDATGKGVRLVEGEPRGEQGGLEEQQHEVLHGLVALVGLGALAELVHDGVVRVDLHSLLGRHVGAHGVVTRAWAFMMRSMLALQPYSPVTRVHGESTRRSDTTTFPTLSPRMSFMRRQRASNWALISSFLSCCTAYSSIGSTMKSTSRPRFLRRSMKG